MKELSNSKNHSKSLFTKDEDKLLSQLYQIYPKQWKIISHFLPGRNPRQCHDRYTTYLDPNISSQEWNIYEDNLIFEKIKEIGPKWVKISKFFNGRSDTAIKNRYNTLIRRFNRDFKTGNLLNITNKSYLPLPIISQNSIFPTFNDNDSYLNFNEDLEFLFE